MPPHFQPKILATIKLKCNIKINRKAENLVLFQFSRLDNFLYKITFIKYILPALKVPLPQDPVLQLHSLKEENDPPKKKKNQNPWKLNSFLFFQPDQIDSKLDNKSSHYYFCSIMRLHSSSLPEIIWPPVLVSGQMNNR